MPVHQLSELVFHHPGRPLKMCDEYFDPFPIYVIKEMHGTWMEMYGTWMDMYLKNGLIYHLMHSNFHGRYSSYVWWGPKNITSSGWRKICFFISMWFMFWNLRVLSTRLVSFFPKKLHHPRSSSENWAGEMGGSPSFTRSGACCSKIFTKCCLRAAFPMAKRHNRRRKAYFLGTSLHQHVEKLIRWIEWISLVDKRATTR